MLMDVNYFIVKYFESFYSGFRVVMEKNEELIDIQSSVAVTERVKINVKGGAVYAFFKRAFDIFASLIAIIILLIPMLIVDFIVWISSKGPALFLDKRIGLNGKEITVLKFRTMFYDAEERLMDYLTPEQYEQWLIDRKIDNDPRITPVGRFLRKTSIDELPQLLNIFIGDMSFVGPRPITKQEFDTHFDEYEQSIFVQAKPGLTGYWQVYGRSDISFENGERQKLELEYFEKRGFWFDIGLIFLTVPAVIKGRGAQ